MNLRQVLMRRTPLELCALSIMVLSLIVVALSFTYIFGIDILSRIIPDVPKPNPISLHSSLSIIFDVILPIFMLFAILYILSLPLRYVLARKRYQGYRSEFALIAYSLLMIVFALQYLESYVSYAGSFKSSLIPFSLVPLFLTAVTAVIAVVYRYFIDEKPQGWKDYFTGISLILFFLCMAIMLIIFIICEYLYI